MGSKWFASLILLNHSDSTKRILNALDPSYHSVVHDPKLVYMTGSSCTSEIDSCQGGLKGIAGRFFEDSVTHSKANTDQLQSFGRTDAASNFHGRYFRANRL